LAVIGCYGFVVKVVWCGVEVVAIFDCCHYRWWNY
jgi:hypothetical protein